MVTEERRMKMSNVNHEDQEEESTTLQQIFISVFVYLYQSTFYQHIKIYF